LWTVFDSAESRLAGHERQIESHHIAEKPDLTFASAGRRVGRTWDTGELRLGMAVVQARGDQFLQVQHTGPGGIEYVNPTDDPRKTR